MYKNNEQYNQGSNNKKIKGGVEAFDQVISQYMDIFFQICGKGALNLVRRPFLLCFIFGVTLTSSFVLKIFLKKMGYFPIFLLPHYQYWVIFSFHIVLIFFLSGLFLASAQKKFEKAFHQIGLTNGANEVPHLVKEKQLGKDRTQYIFDTHGIALNEFESKKERIESIFRKNIEGIRNAHNKGLVILTLTTKNIPKKLSYAEMEGLEQLPRDSMYLGISNEGPIVQSITDLPHMLIAGTTGSGKSVFFKQALLGLLESGPYTQMYLIDLKGGLEMADFMGPPNIKVIKTMDEAVVLLRMVEKEMKDRFVFLESSGGKKIVPEKDKKDRIIIAVDEASVLYMKRDKHDPECLAALEARRIADSICKLSRAAAIHLMLATQKIDKQVIPTSVSENISGRMAFRANSLQGSMIVLGCKDALDLPEIPGRGIWSYGIRKIIIQSPYVDEQTIKNKCKKIAKDFDNGVRTMFSPMIGDVVKRKAKVTSSFIADDIKEIPF